MRNHKLISSLVFFLLLAFTIKAQIITTVAGNGTTGFSGNGGKLDPEHIGLLLLAVTV